MNASSLISELYQHLHEHGDLAVFPIGNGASAIHSVYVENGTLIVSDSLFGSIGDAFRDRPGSDDASEREHGGESAPIFGGIGDMFRAPEVYAQGCSVL